MDYTKATNTQLWSILRADYECPLPLLEGVFNEAVYRGMIRRFILYVVKEKYTSSKNAQEQLKITHEDLIQLGYEGASIAMKKFKPGKASFNRLLFICISNVFGQQRKYILAEKRQFEECSYNESLSDDNSVTWEKFLVDYRTNVEKAVITKIRLEEKLSLLSEVQKDTFLRFYKGFTYQEIADQMNISKNTVSTRMSGALKRMTGQHINLFKLGFTEKTFYKVRGA